MKPWRVTIQAAPDPWYPFGMESAQRKQGRPATTAEALQRLLAATVRVRQALWSLPKATESLGTAGALWLWKGVPGG